MAIGVEPVGKISHLAGTTIGQPLLKPLEIGRGDGGRGPGQIEAQPQRFLLEGTGQRGGGNHFLYLSDHFR